MGTVLGGGSQDTIHLPNAFMHALLNSYPETVGHPCAGYLHFEENRPASGLWGCVTFHEYEQNAGPTAPLKILTGGFSTSFLYIWTITVLHSVMIPLYVQWTISVHNQTGYFPYFHGIMYRVRCSVLLISPCDVNHYVNLSKVQCLCTGLNRQLTHLFTGVNNILLDAFDQDQPPWVADTKFALKLRL